MSKLNLFLPIILGGLMMFAFVWVVQSAELPQAGGFISVNTNSGGTGGPDCTIRDAMTTANSGVNTGGCALIGSGTPVTISLDAIGPYTLTVNDNIHIHFGYNGLPIVTSEIVIEGNGQTIIRDDQSNTLAFRIFLVETSGSLSLRDLTIQNGFMDGSSVDGSGGGIFNLGYLSLLRTSVVSNTVGGGVGEGEGGGIMNYGPWNSVTPTLIIEDSYISYNEGDGIYSHWGTVQITNSTIHHNHGRGIRSEYGRTDISNSTVSDNDGCPGAIFSAYSSFSLIGSTVSGNTCSFGGFGGGGGVVFWDGPVLIQDTTINNNSYSGTNYGGGGIQGISDQLRIINSTISGNYSGALGGGLYLGGVVTITNSTISGNDALTEGDGIYTLDGSILTLINSIVTHHPGDDCAINGVITGSNNLIDTTSCGATRLMAVTNFDPVLADHGGPTWTHALLTGSNAMDAIECDSVPAADQRGIARPQDGNGDGAFLCDIGSFEQETLATPTPTSTPEPTITHTPTLTLTPTPSATLSPTVTPTPGSQKPYDVFLPMILHGSP